MRDGIYQLTYAGVSFSALGVFVIRNGKFSGVGQAGALYHGTCMLDPARNLYQMAGTATLKANTSTVTGFLTGDQDATFPIKAELSSPDPSTRFSIDFAGRSVDVAATYVCPIPG